ncbi:MAG: ABC transporter permease [Gammaproteobacteria bacterium]|nr:ABC transporter permease [Gammaproteobacteria bacterium]
MFGYYLSLGLRSLRRNPVLTALMVFGIALGIAASMTSLTVFRLMGSDPIPWKSDRLHVVQLDNWDVNQAYDEENGRLPDQLSYLDATALIAAGRADRQVAMYKVVLPVQPANDAGGPEVKPYLMLGRATYSDFFPMFEPPFRYGGPWSREQDDAKARVTVLTQTTNEKLFGGADSTGKTVRFDGVDYTVVGVLDRWQPRIKYFDLTVGALTEPEEAFIPFTTAIDLRAQSSGNNSCFKTPAPGWDGFLASDCIWIQFWVQLDTPAREAEYKNFLDAYVMEQKKLGRFERPLATLLPDVNEWIALQEVVSRDVEIQVGLAFAFLAVCLVNTVGLLLAKFMRKRGEIGLRRALGASRGQLFTQHLIEAGVVGISGGIVGLALTGLGLMGVRALYSEFQAITELDWTMVAVTLLLSVLSATLAGLFPTWHACRVQPASQLKTQ